MSEIPPIGFLRGTADPQHFTVKDARGEIVDPKEAIVPVFRSNPDESLTFLGTAFFVTRSGWFVSAKHVIQEATDSPSVNGLVVLQFAADNKYYIRTVRCCLLHEKADVGIGVCHGMSHKVTGQPLLNRTVTLSNYLPGQGQTVWTYAYPGTTATEKRPQHIQINPLFFVGKVRKYFDAGRDSSMLPLPCLETSMVLHGGSSGGPVFGPGSAVFGINSTGYEGDMDVSFVSRIVDVFDLRMPDVQIHGEPAPRASVSLRELAKLGHAHIKGL